MLGWALFFFIVALVAALFGFGGVTATLTGLAQILFAVFVVLFLGLLVVGLFARGSTVP